MRFKLLKDRLPLELYAAPSLKRISIVINNDKTKLVEFDRLEDGSWHKICISVSGIFDLKAIAYEKEDFRNSTGIFKSEKDIHQIDITCEQIAVCSYGNIFFS